MRSLAVLALLASASAIQVEDGPPGKEFNCLRKELCEVSAKKFAGNMETELKKQHMTRNLDSLHSLVIHGAQCSAKVADTVRDEAAHQLKKGAKDKLTEKEFIEVFKGTKEGICQKNQKKDHKDHKNHGDDAPGKEFDCLRNQICDQGAKKFAESVEQIFKQQHMKQNLMNLHAITVSALKCPSKVADRVRDEGANQLKKGVKANLSKKDLVDVIKGTADGICPKSHKDHKDHKHDNQHDGGHQDWSCIANPICGQKVHNVVKQIEKDLKADGQKQTASGMHAFLIQKFHCPADVADAMRENAGNIAGKKHGQHLSYKNLHLIIKETKKAVCKK